jgi:thiosulfate/3-mercaptopyruvate sulfurtransferase
LSATYRYPQLIVGTDALAASLDDPALRLFECTTYLDPPAPDTKAPYIVRPGRAEYEAGHIPGAAFIDLQQDLSDSSSPSHLRFTMPGADALAQALGALGIDERSHVVLYSRGNMQWATRVWWMLRAIGVDNAAVLDGGHDQWVSEGRALSTTAHVYAACAGPKAEPRPGLFANKDAVQSAIGQAGVCTINALSESLHTGESERYGRAGRIPGSVNVPAMALQNPKFPSPDDAAKHFDAVGLNKGERAIVYCGGGIAATLDAFLLVQLGFDDVAVYDASMSEWAKDDLLPMETG